MSGRLAWFAWLLSLTVAAVTVLLLVLAPSTDPILNKVEVRTSQVLSVLVALGCATLYALIAWRQPALSLGWVNLTFWLLIGLVELTYYAWYVLVTSPRAMPAGWTFDWLGWVANGLWVPIFSMLAALALIFPTGRLPSRRWRPVASALVTAPALLGLGIALYPDPLDITGWLFFYRVPDAVFSFPFLTVQSPFGLQGPAADALRRIFAPGLLLFLATPPLVMVVALVVRYRRANFQERQQIKWVMYAWALIAAVLAVSATGVFGTWTAAVSLLGDGVSAIAIGIAILKYRLYDIDLLIHRTVVYGALTACVVGLYVLVVGALGALLQISGNVGISLLATGVVAVLFQPLREWLQRGVNHLLYGQRDEPYAVLSRLGQRLEATLAPEAVLPSIVETVRDALKLPYAALALRGADGLVPAAAAGEPSTEVLRLPLIYQHEPVGELQLGPRGRGEPWSPADRRLLEDLARQAGVAAHAIRLTAELQRSRERLVNTREEERRRLRRDLHDDLAPTIAALALSAATARDRSRENATTAALLDELHAGLRGAVGDIRRLVYELRPPALDELGLVAALRERAAQYSAPERNGLRVAVEAPERLPALPAAVEVAAYRIVQEALMNVARHAQAQTCIIRLALAGGLALEISDDGVGLPATYRAGAGLSSMRERAEELGGCCTVERRDGAGTRVRAWLPLSKKDADGPGARPSGR